MLERGKMERDVIEIVGIDSLVPQDHLLRKIDRAVDFSRLYEMVEPLYCEDNGRPSVDPVVLFKMVLIQHLYGLPSLRRTAEEVSLNIAYRWFLGYSLQEETPHFSTVSYNFRHRFTEETVDQVFRWILEEAAEAGYLSPKEVFIDDTHIKANASTKKQVKAQVPAASKVYAKELMEEVNADREAHGKSKYDYKNKDTDNSRNGHSSKTLRTSFGDGEVSVPRDRKGEFEPQVLKKNQTSISQDIEEKILSMYAKGMTTGDIETHIQDIYGISVSDSTVSRITDKILPVAKEWQQRPLEAIYAVVFLENARAIVVLPTPGMSSSRICPLARKASMVSRTSLSFPSRALHTSRMVFSACFAATFMPLLLICLLLQDIFLIRISHWVYLRSRFFHGIYLEFI